MPYCFYPPDFPPDPDQMSLALCQEQKLNSLCVTHEEKHITSSQVVS